MTTLINKAQNILKQNWKEGFTIPTKKLYPFQWNWDSGFTCLGHSYHNIDYTIKEVESLFSGQWKNGMLPHIIFHSENEKTYFPNYDFWNSKINSGAPLKPQSSGITQPAVYGFILENLLNKYPNNQTFISFIKEIFPKVVHSHRFFYQHRDPKKEGLVFIFHPWESGRDNSPLWDGSLKRIEIKTDKLPSYKRVDTHITHKDERPTSFQYDRYVYLLELGKKYKYDEIEIFNESPFLIQDTLINTTLIKSNESLINIGNMFNLDVGEIKEWQQQSKPKFEEKFWNENLQMYLPYDVREDKQITFKEIGGLVALYAQIPSQDRAYLLKKYLSDLHERGYNLCPSFDVDSPMFDSKRYWRGPVWPQMNWMIYHGLKEYGYTETAEIVKSDLNSLISRMGFYEYFEPQKHIAEKLTTGYGGKDFSWTAACFLDLMLSS